MSVNSAEDDILPSKNLEEAESPRKRARLDNSARKGWSLMDRRTDQEVLHEMGVSVLEQDEGEVHSDALGAGAMHHKPTLKRKRDIENVNPNVNSSVTSPRPKSPRGKYSPSPKSPRGKYSPSAGPSKHRSPRSAEKCKPVHHAEQQDQHALETTLTEEYLVDEETPSAQSVCAQYKPPAPEFDASATSSGGKRQHRSFTPLGLEEEMIISRRSRCEPHGADSFAALSDEMMLSVLRWLPKRSLAHCMLVCKRWHRVACDETLWQRLDLGNKALSKDALGRILARKPVIIRLAASELGEWHPPSFSTPSRVQYLDLSTATADPDTLDCLVERCPMLKKLSLEIVTLRDSTCGLIGKCRNLETLNLTMAQGVTAEGLASILEGCHNLQALNISWCNLSEAALEVLVSMLPSRLQRLNVGGARIMSDEMVMSLVERCPRLLELDMSDCSRLGVPAVTSVLSLSRLEHLALSRCYLLPPHVFTKLRSMPALQYLEVWGMLPTASLSALRGALPTIQINQFMFSAIARPTVGTRRTSIWGLRTRD